MENLAKLYENKSFFTKNYEVIATYELIKGQKIILGDKSKRKCRFCGKGKGDVSFKSKAHAIPQLLGNNELFSYYECDPCNKEKFHKLEDHLAKFLGIWRTFSGVRGKNGIPKYKINKSSITAMDNGIFVFNCSDDLLFREKADANELAITAVKRPYIPLNVFKALVKMALSIMPESEMKFFQETRKWLMSEDKIFHYLPLLYEFVPMQDAFKSIVAAVVKRKETTLENVPYAYFFLTLKNLRLQIYIPQCERDKKITGKFTIHHFPSPYNFFDNTSEKPKLGMHDLSSTEMIRNEADPLSFKYGYKIEK